MRFFEKIINTNFLILIITGVIFGLSFPPFNFHYLIFISLVSYISIITYCINIFQVIRKSFVVFFFAGLTSISWIALSGFREGADWFIIVGGIFTIFFHTIFYIIPSIFLYLIYKSQDRLRFKYLFLVSFPFVWTSFEYLQTLGQINFPWLIIAYTQTYNLNKIQYADVTGMYGISFWICVISVFIFILISKYREGNIDFKSSKFYLSIIFILIIYMLPDFYKPDIEKYNEGKKVNTGIIQPNINPWKKWGARFKELNQDYINQYNEISKDSKLDLVILPETAFPFYFRYDYYDDQYVMFKRAIDSVGIPLLTGSPDIYVYKKDDEIPSDARKFNESGDMYDVFNSALLINPNDPKDSITIYNKIKLVAGSERMPYQEKLTFLRDLIKWGVGLSAFQTGRDTVIFDLDGIKFNTAICYESVFPEFISKFVNKGSEFIVIITNDGWWGKLAGTYQHNQYAVFRSIENRRWIARCANTGISCFISPEGVKYDETKIDEKINIKKEITAINELTFYSVNGDLFARICLFITLLTIISVFIIQIKFKITSSAKKKILTEEVN